MGNAQSVGDSISSGVKTGFSSVVGGLETGAGYLKDGAQYDLGVANSALSGLGINPTAIGVPAVPGLPQLGMQSGFGVKNLNPFSQAGSIISDPLTVLNEPLKLLEGGGGAVPNPFANIPGISDIQGLVSKANSELLTGVKENLTSQTDIFKNAIGGVRSELGALGQINQSLFDQLGRTQGVLEGGFANTLSAVEKTGDRLLTRVESNFDKVSNNIDKVSSQLGSGFSGLQNTLTSTAQASLFAQQQTLGAITSSQNAIANQIASNQNLLGQGLSGINQTLQTAANASSQGITQLLREGAQTRSDLTAQLMNAQTGLTSLVSGVSRDLNSSLLGVSQNLSGNFNQGLNFLAQQNQLAAQTIQGSVSSLGAGLSNVSEQVGSQSMYLAIIAAAVAALFLMMQNK
jgi:hypothetical protein